MGLNVNSVKFLLLAHAQGISFNRVLMIGRQSLTVTPRDIHRLVKLPLSTAMQSNLRSLELGPGMYAEQFFRLCGAEKVDSMDKTSYEGATVLHDLNLPVPDTLFRTYDLIVDGGSIEHIFNIPTAFQNYMHMLKIGGYYVCNTATNNYSGHGFYQLSPELFYAVFAPENGFNVRDAYLYEENGKNRWYRLSQPASAARRMTFQNKVPAHLLILAQKIADTAVFEHFPQQRMYHAAWTNANVARRPAGTVKTVFFRWLGYLPPQIMWLVLNTWNIWNRFRTDLFTRVP